MAASDVLDSFHPLVRDWFLERFPGGPSEPQRRGWPSIQDRKDTLIAAPTGSGKTLTAFLAGINKLIEEDARGGLRRELRILYISPLKALANDIQRNLETPLEEIRQIAGRQGREQPEIVTAVWTGDTEEEERNKIRTTPPHILNTTPESLSNLLTDQRSRPILRTVDAVIIDEIHNLVASKRGSHLSLSLARLDAVARTRPARIGLSATQKPMHEVAAFLSGVDASGNPLTCEQLDLGHIRERDLGILFGFDAMCDLIDEHRQTLIFTNMRDKAEVIAGRLNGRFGEQKVGVHHGSLSKERREPVEEQLKAGTLRAVAATASLELGIDIGDIDIVCQIGSTGNVATFLQRVGRAGHRVSAVPTCGLFPQSRGKEDQLIECCILIEAAQGGVLESIRQPQAPLDVLAQQITAEIVAGSSHPDQLFSMFRRAYPYAKLTRAEFDAVVVHLLEGLDSRHGFPFGRMLYQDESNNLLARKVACKEARRNVGSIPPQGEYAVQQTVYTQTRDRPVEEIGSVDPEWILWQAPEKTFQMANKPWTIQSVDSKNQIVWVDRVGDQAKPPYWIADGLGRSRELSEGVSALRRQIVDYHGSDRKLAAVLQERFTISSRAAFRIIEYVGDTYYTLGIIPSDTDIVIEQFHSPPPIDARENEGDPSSFGNDDLDAGLDPTDIVVVHAPFGSGITRAWALAITSRLRKLTPESSDLTFTQEGFAFTDLPADDTVPKKAFEELSSGSAAQQVHQAVLNTAIFHQRWRWAATTSQAILQFYRGNQRSLADQQEDALDLIDRLFPATHINNEIRSREDQPDHPLVRQAVHDCLHEALDLQGLIGVLRRVEAGDIRVHYRRTDHPSPMAANMLRGNRDFGEEVPFEPE